MVYIISKPTRREAEDNRREGLAKAGLSPKQYRGTAQSLDEAHETQRGLERDGERFDKLWEVFGPDAKKSEDEMDLRAGRNPETGEVLHG